MIKRNGPKDYQYVDRLSYAERNHEDFDLRFTFETSTTTIYVLDKGEIFRFHKSFIEGPTLVIYQELPSGLKVEECHVNDPRIWCWVQRNIKDGTFGSNSQAIYADREFIDVKPYERKKAKAAK